MPGWAYFLKFILCDYLDVIIENNQQVEPSKRVSAPNTGIRSNPTSFVACSSESSINSVEAMKRSVSWSGSLHSPTSVANATEVLFDIPSESFTYEESILNTRFQQQVWSN